MTCPFCQIAAGELTASLVWEDQAVLGFLDLRPVRPGHVLLIPRVHARHLHELAEPDAMWAAGRSMAAALRACGLADDVHWVVNDGPAALQTVPHVHLHLVPRRRGDGWRFALRLLALPIAPLLPAAPRATLDAQAELIRSAR